MTPRLLKSSRKGAAKGKARSVVIFVHGYGANGADLLGLADPMAPYLPHTAFYSPDAPDACPGVPSGYQWFGIPRMDGTPEAVSLAAQKRSALDLNAFIDTVLADEGLEPRALALVGFSQGTMMSLHVAPRRAAALGAVVGFSGRLLQPETLAAETVSRPPVFLIHGGVDPMVPVDSLSEAADALQANEFETYAHVCKGLGHSIDNEGLSLATGFLGEYLPS